MLFHFGKEAARNSPKGLARNVIIGNPERVRIRVLAIREETQQIAINPLEVNAMLARVVQPLPEASVSAVCGRTHVVRAGNRHAEPSNPGGAASANGLTLSAPVWACQ